MTSPAANRMSLLAERLKRPGTAFTAWIGLADAVVPEIFAREGYDLVTFDRQHGALDDAAMLRGIAAVTAMGLPAAVRLTVGGFELASRALDGGASAVIAPMIETVEDARAFASFGKYPPLGERSWGPHRALPLSGLAPADFVREANGFALAIAMVETKRALEIVDDILAVPGIDGVLVGPSDLSMALTGRLDPNCAEVDAALDHVRARTRALGKSAWVYASTPARAADMARKGYDVVAVSGDASVIRDAARAALATARAGAA